MLIPDNQGQRGRAMNIVKRNSPRSSHVKPRYITPLKSGSSPNRGSRKPSTTRLYRAPQASIRSETTLTVEDLKSQSKTRRRRPGSNYSTSTPSSSSRGVRPFTYERQSSDMSLPDELPSSLPFGNNEASERIDDITADLNCSLPEMNFRPRTPRRLRQGCEDVSECMDDSFRSNATLSHSLHYNGAKTRRKQSVPSIASSNVFQLIILLLLGGYIYDSHHKVKKHKVQLKQYDEERSHLLEQMMWIDQAAKKVHQKYADLSLTDLSKETKEELTRDVKTAREQLEKLHVRIQVNDRDYIRERFAEKPVEVGLSVATVSAGDRLSIALSDDTPHAASTFLKQVDKHHWDEIEFQVTDAGAIEARSRQETASPMLEFVEPSRGCHELGSVVLRQEEEHDVVFLSLRVNLKSNIPTADTEVCIGRVARGMEALEAIIKNRRS